MIRVKFTQITNVTDPSPNAGEVNADRRRKQIDAVRKNYMKYVDHILMEHFTVGQQTRIKEVVMIYRSRLFEVDPSFGVNERDTLPFQRLLIAP